MNDSCVFQITICVWHVLERSFRAVVEGHVGKAKAAKIVNLIWNAARGKTLALGDGRANVLGLLDKICTILELDGDTDARHVVDSCRQLLAGGSALPLAVLGNFV